MSNKTPPVLINLGEIIPDIPDIRLGTFVDAAYCEKLGEDDCPDGGYLVWNDGVDWFVVPVDEVIAVADVPAVWTATAP